MTSRARARTLTATALSYDFYGEPARTDSFEITTEANGMTSRTIEFKPEKYSVYTMYLTVSGDGIFSQSKIEYSYVIENEKDNMFMGTNNHIYRLMTETPTKSFPCLIESVLRGTERVSGGIITRRQRAFMPFPTEHSTRLICLRNTE